ncbi:MAG: hypothetical protein FWH27_01655, partial [Planctomycetaceae bacterium]|nr:hypothetical protein [Planctomycetaceae bacterium]
DAVRDRVKDKIQLLEEKGIMVFKNRNNRKEAVIFDDGENRQKSSELPYFRSKDGKRLIPIRKARIYVKKPTIMTVGKNGRERHVEPGSNHHMEIFSLLDDQGNEVGLAWKAVNLFDSVQRLKQKKSVICHSYEEYAEKYDEKKNKKSKKLGFSSAKFKFSLAKGEYVIASPSGEDEVLLKVDFISEGDLSLCLHTDARPTKQRKETGDFQKYRIASIKKLEQFKLRKVTVDVLGKIHPAND